MTLAIRPEKVGLRGAGDAIGENEFFATLADVVYSGAQTQFTLRVKDTTLKVCVLNTKNKNLQPGQNVVAHLPVEKILALDD
jgi:ABC-type Fe3+/spermidine/putrescine transport system ATPase subunit